MLKATKNQHFHFIFHAPNAKSHHFAALLSTPPADSDQMSDLLIGNRTKVNENFPLFGGPYRNSYRQFFYSPNYGPGAAGGRELFPEVVAFFQKSEEVLAVTAP